ncbi:sugar ABC transporter permease [Pararobbsia silviterrae]|uniref:Sugar ABC transporter permease n=1 Tax=Pararobbsia silviterrae TaxID=1792498 RepID=A0A494XV43_9BURK|nr:sugar ABC transporter permease [Pararobbsia silviterrae]
MAPPAPARARPTWRSRLSNNETAVGLLMLGPVFAALVFLRLWPAIAAITHSLSADDAGGGFSLAVYRSLFSDPTFQNALYRTALFSVIVNPFQILLALAIAVLLNRRIALGGLWRTFVLLPVVIPQSVSALIWGVALRPDGPINALLAAIGLPQQGFLTSTTQALPSIIVVVSWVGVGYWTTFLLAGLKDISPSLYEAASLDGASAWQKFRYVTLPMLRRPLLFVLVADTVSNFLVFAPVQILTNGGPQDTTNLIMADIFSRTFVYSDDKGGAAATVILVAVVMLVVTIQFRLMKERGE